MNIGPESNRQRKRRERAAAREQLGTAYQVHPNQAANLYAGTRLDEHAPDEHVWVVLATYRVGEREIRHNQADTVGPPLLLDRESLAYVTTPGCYRCEQVYSPALAARSCPGDPD